MTTQSLSLPKPPLTGGTPCLVGRAPGYADDAAGPAGPATTRCCLRPVLPALGELVAAAAADAGAEAQAEAEVAEPRGLLAGWLGCPSGGM